MSKRVKKPDVLWCGRISTLNLTRCICIEGRAKVQGRLGLITGKRR